MAIAIAAGVVFVAELGDKTQLLALGFGARHGLGVVTLGLAVGSAVAGAVAALVGGALGATLPERPIAVAAGVLFLAVAVWTLLDDEDADEHARRPVRARSVVASIAATIALAEMGDKTQLATAALAARHHPVGTWIGATGGEVAAGLLGTVAGRRIGTTMSDRALRSGSAALFATFGVVILLTA